MAQMKGRVDGRVTGRRGHSGERPSPGQPVAERVHQRPRGSRRRRRLPVEAVLAEAEA